MTVTDIELCILVILLLLNGILIAQLAWGDIKKAENGELPKAAKRERQRGRHEK